MKYLKSYIIAVSMVLVFSLSASAFAPLVYLGYVVGPELAPYALASVALHVSAAAAGLYYYMKGITASTVDNTGVVSKPSEAQWVDTTATPPAVKTKSITASMPYTKVKELVLKKDSHGNDLYPSVHASTQTNLNGPEPLSAKSVVGAVGSVLGAQVKVLTKIVSGTSNDYAGTIFQYLSPHWFVQYMGAPNSYGDGACTSTRMDIILDNSSVLVGLKNNYEWHDAVAVSTIPPDNIIQPQFQTEINRMFQDPDYVPRFTDDTTGFPFVPPSGSSVSTPAQVAAYNNNGKSVDATAAATAASTAAAAIASASAAAAGAAYDAANAAAAAAGGTDAGLNAAAAAAGAAAGAANTAAGNAAAAAAAAAAKDAAVAAEVNAVPSAEGEVSFSWAKMAELKGILSNTFPFNSVVNLNSYVALFSASGSAPSFTMPMPLGNFFLVNLSFFDPVAAVCRWAIAALLTIGAVQYVVHFFRGGN